jgi:hypothetical protein
MIDMLKDSLFITASESDLAWASWLEKGLADYRVPRDLILRGRSPRIGRVFIDRETCRDPASPGHFTLEALDESATLLLVCSPRGKGLAAFEPLVRRFRETGKGDRILALLVEGEPSDSFPDCLRFVTIADAEGNRRIAEVEPLAADVRRLPGSSAGTRRHKKKKAVVRVAAAVLALSFDELWQRSKQRSLQRKRQLIIGGAVGGLGAVALAVCAWWYFGLHVSYGSGIVWENGVPLPAGKGAAAAEDGAWRFEESRLRLRRIVAPDPAAAGGYGAIGLTYSGAGTLIGLSFERDGTVVKTVDFVDGKREKAFVKAAKAGAEYQYYLQRKYGPDGRVIAERYFSDSWLQTPCEDEAGSNGIL